MDLINYVENGYKRIGVYKICPVCNISFITRKNNGNICCSVSCKGQLKSSNSNKEVVCANCNKVFRKKNSSLKLSKSGLYFCSRICKDNAQKIGGIKAIMPPHFGTAKDNYRNLFEAHEFICRRCGYNEFSCGVDIHHIDGNRENNTKENLIPLCKCCHSSLHFNFWKLEELVSWKST